jgi:4-aminobutyrate aminotransferase
MEKGVALKTIEGNILTLRPALNITQTEMDQVINVLDEVIGEVVLGQMY